jgi:hypothetical protein
VAETHLHIGTFDFVMPVATEPDDPEEIDQEWLITNT